MANRRHRKLTSRDIDVLLELPSDSEDDIEINSDDDVLDPDFTGDDGEDSEDQEDGSNEIEEEEEEAEIRNEIQSKQSSNKKDYGHNWVAKKDNLLSRTPPVFTPVQQNQLLASYGEMPIDYFLKLFPHDLFDEIAYQTTLYAVANGKASFHCSVNDLKLFLGINIVMTFLKYSRLHQYWSTECGLRLALVADNISSKRYKEIKRFLHFVDNASIPLENSDKFVKVRPVLDKLQEKYQEALPFEESLSIDEMMVPFKGRCSVKQYIKSKPKKWGIKIWVLAGQSGYVYRIEPYQGASGTRNAPSKEYGAVGDVVLRLLEGLSGKNHKVYADNLFTSIPLVKKLKNEHIFYVGTIRADRMQGAEGKLDSVKSLKQQGRGSLSIATSSDNISVVRWYDNKPVHMASSFAGIEPTDMAERYCKKERKIIEVRRPYLVQLYNSCMGGVDLMDSMIALYRHTVRQKRWYMRVFYHFLNLTVANAWFLWKKDKGGGLDLLEFRSSVAMSLICAGNVPKKRGRPSTENSPIPPKKRTVINVPQEVRFDGSQHFPKKSDKNEPRKCKSQGCKKRTRYLCDRCAVHLCPECFKSFHSK